MIKGYLISKRIVMSSEFDLHSYGSYIYIVHTFTYSYVHMFHTFIHLYVSLWFSFRSLFNITLR